jgi:D-serine deaminase-like pyridoxal phosphate-dependent protein
MSPIAPRRVAEIDTPALVVDLDIFERNLKNMAEFFRGHRANLRPHTKSHKCPEIARQQLASGAIGVTCAKLGEAEVMASYGIGPLLIANQVVGPVKIARLMALAQTADVTVAVDGIDNVAELSAAATAAGVRLPVLVEVDVGMGRCGVLPGAPALALCRAVVGAHGLHLAGLMGFEGHVVDHTSFEARKRGCVAALELLDTTRALVEADGIPVGIVSGGGTGTYQIAGTWPGMTEVQAGSYVFMDATYKAIEGMEAFDCSLTLLATVVSRPHERRAIVDAGLKVLSTDQGLPVPVSPPGARVVGLSEEHGKLDFAEPSRLRIGDRVSFLPSHCCTNVNLHDRLYGVRGERVEVVWDISARGRAQ